MSIEDKALFDVVRKAKEQKVKNTSFIKMHGAAIASKLATEGEHSRELKRSEEEEIKRVYGDFVSDQFVDPYTYEDKVLQHECYREDGIVAACIDFLVQFTLGDHFHTVIDTNQETDDEEANKEAIDSFSKNTTLQRYKSILDNLHRKLNFTEQLRALLTQAMVYGRAAWLIERDPDTRLPIKLKILPSMTLGQIFRHSKTWDLLGVEYLDFPFPESLLKMEDLLYIPIRDYHVSPGSWGYGTSLLERVIDISILNRITNQRNLKEICYRAWAGSMLVKLVGSVNQQTMDKLKEQIANGAGNAIVTNQNVDVQSQKFETDIQGMAEMRDYNEKEILRMLQVPQILFDPQVQNRATSQEVMESWNESVLKTYRTWLSDILEQQWIKAVLKTIIENETRPQVEGGAGTSSPIEPNVNTAVGQDGENTNSSRGQSEGIPRDPQTGELDLDKAKWKIKIVFEPLSFDTKDSEINSTINLFNAGIIDRIKALELVGMEDLIPQAQAEEMANLQEQAARTDLMQQQQQQQEAKAPTPTTTLGKARAVTKSDSTSTSTVGAMRDMMKSFSASQAVEDSLADAKKQVYDEIKKTVAKIAESVT